jgi:hypothetical protein
MDWILSGFTPQYKTDKFHSEIAYNKCLKVHRPHAVTSNESWIAIEQAI